MKKTIYIILTATLFTLLPVTATAQVASSSPYTVEQAVIAAGGGQNSAGGSFALDGTVGQAAAGSLSGGAFNLFGGFWNPQANSGGLIAISGQITSSASSGAPVSGAIVSLSGSASASVVTGSNGSFSFVDLPAGGTYTVTPALTNYTFTPSNRQFVSPVSDQTANFTATTQNCSYSIAPTGASVASGGATGAISVSTAAGCNWTAVANDNWISITPSAGSGAGSVSYTVAANSGSAQRVGTITVAGQTFTVTQAANASAFIISGSVIYGTTPTSEAAKFVPGVTLSATGTSAGSGSTNAAGNYQVSNLTAGGSYTVTPAKTGDVNSITGFDASLVSRKAANLITLTANQLLAADVSNDGSVSGYDASLIARTSSGVANPGIAGRWKFVPSSRTYQNLAANQTAQNYEAILMGEVSGNWTPPTSGNSPQNMTKPEQIKADREEERVYQQRELFEPDSSNNGIAEEAAAEKDKASRANKLLEAQAGISVSLPTNATASNGAVVVVPITVGDTSGQGIFSYDFTVSFDPNVLTPAALATDANGTLSGNAGFSITPNSTVSGRLTVSAFGTQELTGAGTLLNLRFNVVGTANTASGSTALTFTAFMFNEGNPASMTTNGQFTVLAPTAASVTVAGKVLAPSGGGLQNARVIMTDQRGVSRIATTKALGYFRFTDVAAGEVYVFAIQSKKYQFAPQVLFVGEDFDELIFKVVGRN